MSATIERPVPYPNKVTFGPGSLESVTLVSWVAHHTRWVRAKGTYTVYCGSGNSHIVEVDERCPLSDCDSTDTADVAYWLINSALQDWFDPCDTDEEE